MVLLKTPLKKFLFCNILPLEQIAGWYDAETKNGTTASRLEECTRSQASDHQRLPTVWQDFFCTRFCGKQAYFKLTQRYGITPSMSRRGNPYDNALAENFFSILKTECIYRRKIATLAEARELIDDYIFFYNNQRIQTKTKLTPLKLRHQYVA